MFFYFSSSFTAQFLLFDIRDIKRGNWEWQIAGDGELNIYFKNNFNLFVMNVTQLNFLNWQNEHIWNFIKVNYKKGLLFVVVPTLIRWRKTKIFTDYNNKVKTKNAEVFISFICFSSVKLTVMQIEKALINNRLGVSKVSGKFRIPTIYNHTVIYPWNLLCY